MNSLLASLAPLAVLALRYVGQVLLGLVIQLLTGRTLKRLLVMVVSKITKKTKTEADDKLVEEAKKDLGLDP